MDEKNMMVARYCSFRSLPEHRVAGAVRWRELLAGAWWVQAVAGVVGGRGAGAGGGGTCCGTSSTASLHTEARQNLASMSECDSSQALDCRALNGELLVCSGAAWV